MGNQTSEPLPPVADDWAGYFDVCATSPPSAAVLEAMASAHRRAWANPSSLHDHGLRAAELLERSRQQLASDLGCDGDELILCSGASEAIHLALLGVAERLPLGRLLISAVEHPATLAAAHALERRGWQVDAIPVDETGEIQLLELDRLLAPPTRLVSLIWGQSEVGALQPIEAVGERCRQRGVVFHVDAVQVVGHRPLRFADLPVDLLSCAAHKLQGPRGIGALLVRSGVHLEPLIGGGGQERGRRGGTEAVALVAGFAQALADAQARLARGGGRDPSAQLRDRLLAQVLACPGVRLSGPDPRHHPGRLPHHLSLLIADDQGRPLAGRAIVRAMARRGWAISSGSACRSGQVGGGASPVLLAMGYSPEEAASGVRISLGPWHTEVEVVALAHALAEVRAELGSAGGGTA